VLQVDLDWKTGVAAKDWGNIAKKEKLDVSLCLLPPLSLMPPLSKLHWYLLFHPKLHYIVAPTADRTSPF